MTVSVCLCELQMENACLREPGLRVLLSPKDAGLSHLTKTSVIPTGAERSEAQWRDLFCCFGDKKRSLGYAAPSTSLGAGRRLRSG
jgi:hypothetical protein